MGWLSYSIAFSIFKKTPNKYFNSIYNKLFIYIYHFPKNKIKIKNVNLYVHYLNLQCLLFFTNFYYYKFFFNLLLNYIKVYDLIYKIK